MKTESHAQTNIALCELLGIAHEGRANLRVTLEIIAGRHPVVTVRETLVRRPPGVVDRERCEQFVLISREEADYHFAGPRVRFPPGSVRAAVAHEGDSWRSAFFDRRGGYMLDGERVPRAAARDLAIMQRAAETRDRGTLWDARVWSGIPFGERIWAAHGK